MGRKLACASANASCRMLQNSLQRLGDSSALRITLLRRLHQSLYRAQNLSAALTNSAHRRPSRHGAGDRWTCRLQRWPPSPPAPAMIAPAIT